jgi:hypothetical protein
VAATAPVLLSYTTSGGGVSVTGYTGSCGVLIIPSSIGGLPVTSLGPGAFSSLSGLTSVTIPGSVTTIGEDDFSLCSNLTNLTILNGVTTIEADAFAQCSRLTSVTISADITSIGDNAFTACSSLRSVYFGGNAPILGVNAFSGDLGFNSGTGARVYYLPGTTGWSSTFAGVKTALWQLPYPVILNNGPNFGVQSNAFGFTISWATNTSFVVEASTDLAGSVWTPLQTNTLTNGSFYFSDPAWASYPNRFYRISAP